MVQDVAENTHDDAMKPTTAGTPCVLRSRQEEHLQQLAPACVRSDGRKDVREEKKRREEKKVTNRVCMEECAFVKPLGSGCGKGLAPRSSPSKLLANNNVGAKTALENATRKCGV